MTTSQPNNASEWQLYRVLQRANLLQYYDTFVAQGGDDVQQLCEAGEEEFLEIMALVGMASKPLHVRRLQKALQEWVANPAAFQGNGTNSLLAVVREPPTHVYSLPNNPGEVVGSPWGLQSSQARVSPVSMVATNRMIDYQADMGQMKKQSTSPQPTPVLLESQINEIAKCASKLAATLPFFEAKPLNMKKDINKQIYEVLSMPNDDPSRLETFRQYGAIYRRFDSTRVYEKPMSLHEICVNEAAAQLCFHMPSLLTRREDLFPLARQVVKDSGYQYSKGHSRASELCPSNPSKRQKIELLTGEYSDVALKSASLDGDKFESTERLNEIGRELSEISSRQEQIVSELDSAKEGQDNEKIEMLQLSLEQITNKHLQLLTEQSDLLRKQSYEVYLDNDNSSDRDSNFGASGSSSPSQGDRDIYSHPALKAMLSSGQLPKSAFTKTGMKNSLFDEGLRIAQQYGLGDFAQELKSLQGDDEEEEGEDENVPSAAQVLSVNSKLSHDIPNGALIGSVDHASVQNSKHKTSGKRKYKSYNGENGVKEEVTSQEVTPQEVNKKEVNGV